METKYIISIESGDSYPFEGFKANCRPFVRETVLAKESPSSQVVKKIEMLLRIDSSVMIRPVKMVQVGGRSVEVDYEYVEESFSHAFRQGEIGSFANFKDKLIDFLKRLAEIGVKKQINVSDIGVNSLNDPKLFMSHTFTLVPPEQRADLLPTYLSSVDRIFRQSRSPRGSMRAASDLSDYSQRLDQKISDIQNKLSRKWRKKSSFSQRSSLSKKESPPKVPLGPNSQDTTSYSCINAPTIKKQHKSSFQEFGTTSYKLNEAGDQELKRRVNRALQKTEKAFKVYEKYSKRKEKR